MRLLTAISIASLVVSIVAVVFVLGLYAELDKTETSNAPLLDEKTVIDITRGFVADNFIKATSVHSRWLSCEGKGEEFIAEYVGGDIWVVKIENSIAFCTFTVHDKEAHVILPK